MSPFPAWIPPVKPTCKVGLIVSTADSISANGLVGSLLADNFIFNAISGFLMF